MNYELDQSPELQGIIEKELGRKILDYAQGLAPHWEQILAQKSV